MMRKYGSKRDASEKAVVEALRACGASVYLLDQPMDLLVGFRGRTYICEVKTPKTQYGKKLKESQQKFADEWRGGTVHIFRTIQDVTNWVNNPNKREVV